MSKFIKNISLSGCGCVMTTDDPAPILKLETEGVPEQIRILCHAGSVCLYDSKKQHYRSPFIPLEISLKPKSDYQIEVFAWKGKTKDSASLHFETGFLNAPWKADWIEPVQKKAIREPLIHFHEIFRPWPEAEDDGANLRNGQLLQKTFCVRTLPKKARLYATAHGIYRLYLNGNPINTARLSPEITPYQNYLYYQTYDILPYLKTGDNELVCELCDGWWIGRIGLSGDSCQYGNRLAFLAQLELDKRTIVSDETWMCRPSYIQYADLYIGEKWNLGKRNQPWKNCIKADYPKNNLVAQPIPQIRPLRELKGRLYTSPKGELIADFGEVIAGVIHLEADLQKKTEITLEHSETADQNGSFFKNIIGRNKQQRDKILSPRGPLVFEPHHTYHGFRYVRISGISRSEIKEIKAIVIGTPLRNEGFFSCSDPRLNRLQENIYRSMQSNMISIPTDCPQREKMGWTGDLQIFTKTGSFNCDLLPFLSAWLKGLRSEQAENGEIPLISPNFPRADAMQRESGGENSSSAWGDACILVPWYLYQCTGDLQVLKDNLQMMESWLYFIAQAAAQKPEHFDTLTTEQKERNPYLWQSGHHFGDWMIPSMSSNPEDIAKSSAVTGPVIASFFYVISLRAYINVLTSLSEDGDPSPREKKEAAETLLKKILSAVRAEYISSTGRVQGDLQGVYVLALYSGAAQGQLKQKVAARLVKLIQKNGGRLDTGFVSTPYLLDVLVDCGYPELAYQLLFSEKSPSWLYMVQKGASTIWENWNAVLPDGTVTASSMNHYALGSVGDFIYRRIGGINALQPGYRSVRFAPDFRVPLSRCECRKLTAYGEVSCIWKKTAKGYRLFLKTPVEAELILPGRKEKLLPGSYVKYFKTPK